ncbi:MAG: hypothetical protein HQL37_15705, partial [Alphaproteobacteria bacterium]|nr:hypothetical protein [Alphaproteobacteria bacterium]
MGGKYKIVESQYQILGGIAGHNILVEMNQDNEVVGEINGGAFDKDDHWVKVGGPSDRLGVSFTQILYKQDQPQYVLYSGSEEDVSTKWGQAVAAGNAINASNRTYDMMATYSYNSNSVSSTVIDAMGLQEQDIPDGAFMTPGQGQIIPLKDDTNPLNSDTTPSPSSSLMGYDVHLVAYQNPELEPGIPGWVHNSPWPDDGYHATPEAGPPDPPSMVITAPYPPEDKGVARNDRSNNFQMWLQHNA